MLEIRTPVDLVPEYSGSQTSLARLVIEDLKAHGEVASTGVQLYLYSEASGAWEIVTQDDFIGHVTRYDGVQRDPGDKGKGIFRINHNTAVGAHKIAVVDQGVRSKTHFDKPRVGVNLQDSFIAIGENNFFDIGHDPSNKARHTLPFDWNPKADWPKWEKFLNEIFDGDQDAQSKKHFLQEFVGACLAGIAPNYDTCAMLVGHGSNGKSAFIDVVQRLFPLDAIGRVSLQDLSREYSLSTLLGKAVNMCGEISDKRLFEADLFKEAVSGGLVSARDPYGKPYTFRPTCGHVFSANSLPSSADHSDGFWRRFVCVDFNRHFANGSLILRNKLVQDLCLELPGILIWALHGAVRLSTNGHYTVPESSVMRKKEWRLDSDLVAEFVDSCIVPEPEIKLRALVAYNAFKSWAIDTGHQPVTLRTLCKRMRQCAITCRRDSDGVYFCATIKDRSDWRASARAASAFSFDN